MKKFFLILIIINFLTACQSTKDALTLKKKNSADEFLVEKKNPLVLPPNYGELPIPQEEELKKENNNLEVTLDKEKFKIEKIIENSEPTPLENSILKKIK